MNPTPHTHLPGSRGVASLSSEPRGDFGRAKERFMRLPLPNHKGCNPSPALPFQLSGRKFQPDSHHCCHHHSQGTRASKWARAKLAHKGSGIQAIQLAGRILKTVSPGKGERDTNSISCSDFQQPQQPMVPPHPPSTQQRVEPPIIPSLPELCSARPNDWLGHNLPI